MKPILPLFLLSALAPLTILSAAAPPARHDPAVEDAHDLVVLHPSRPYRVRLHLRVAGRPFQAAWNQQVAQLFRFLDANGDGVLSKAEASRAPSREQWQQLTAGSAQLDPDACPAFAELARGKAAATLADVRAYYSPSTAGPLQVHWGTRRSGPDVLSEALFRFLDTDRDGKLSRTELQAAPRVLNRLDFNEDEMVSPTEIMGRGFFDPGPGTTRGPAHGSALGGMPFFSLRPEESVTPLVVALIARYDRNRDGKLSRYEIGFDDKTFARLDRDGDGQLDAAELARWPGLPADLEADVTLGGNHNIRVMPGRSAALRTQLTHEGLLVVVRDWCVELRLDRTPPPPARRAAEARQLFRALDRNANGYLESAEIFQPPFSYVALLRLADRDGDGRLSRKEFLAFSEVRQQVQGSLTFARLEDMGQSLFRLLDSDRDGRLGQRELRDAWKQLQAWDRSGASSFRRETLPNHYRLTLGHGPPESPEQRFLLGEQTPRSPRGPLWFRKMDRNGDGDVSRAEWLGTEEQFRAIDTDGDGLLSVAEAEAFDKRTRAKAGK